ncbi:MAG: transposase [Bryobacterales bacterium]|jgi:hypothetical protein|nr:transposase [Bryobacterales bacterium]
MIPAVIERCAGIDAGKKFVAVCVMTGPADQEGRHEMRKFGTIRAELTRLRECLKAEGCTDVVMESTGCYWKPVLNVLEDDPDYRPRIVPCRCAYRTVYGGVPLVVQIASLAPTRAQFDGFAAWLHSFVLDGELCAGSRAGALLGMG